MGEKIILKKMKITRKYFADLILAKLISQKESLKKEFNQSGRINTCIIDNLFPNEVATEIYKGYPSPEEMTTYKSV